MTIRISFAISPKRLYEETQVRDILKSVQSAYSEALTGNRDASNILNRVRFSKSVLGGYEIPELENIVQHVQLISNNMGERK